MKCSNCGVTIENPVTIRFNKPIYIKMLVQYNRNDLFRIEEPTLEVLPEAASLDISNRENFTVYCPGCKRDVPLSDFTEAPSCICGASVHSDNYCAVNKVNFCKYHYPLLMSKICGDCPVRGVCPLYQKGVR